MTYPAGSGRRCSTCRSTAAAASASTRRRSPSTTCDWSPTKSGSHGVRRLLPDAGDRLLRRPAHGFATLARACDADADLAPRDARRSTWRGRTSPREDGPRGAHPKAHVRPPDSRRVPPLAGRGRRADPAGDARPGAPGGCAFIEWLTAQGVVVAIGHTAATGRRSATRRPPGRGSARTWATAAHAVLPRHDNYVWEQLAARRAVGQRHRRRAPPAAGRAEVRAARRRRRRGRSSPATPAASRACRRAATTVGPGVRGPARRQDRRAGDALPGRVGGVPRCVRGPRGARRLRDAGRGARDGGGAAPRIVGTSAAADRRGRAGRHRRHWR